MKKIWKKHQKLIEQGYRILDKEIIFNIPATSFPAGKIDTGIGTPYGLGAQKLFDFFFCHKALLTPTGITFASNYSPYESGISQSWFLLDLDKFIDKPPPYQITDGVIDFPHVGHFYNEVFNRLPINQNISDEMLIAEAKYYAPFNPNLFLSLQELIKKQAQNAQKPYISDVPIKQADIVLAKHKDWFFKNTTLGVPPDMFSNQARNWNFKIFKPEAMVTLDGKLGPAGKYLLAYLKRLLANNRGGVRIDHFIAWINPYVFTPKGSHRLYKEAQTKYVKKILLRALNESNLDTSALYPEDLGARPAGMDEIMRQFKLGRMLVSQFVNPDDEKHLYRLKNAHYYDVAMLDTHDTMSIQSFFENMDAETKEKHARQLAADLRWNYTPDLCKTENLVRMKWAELLACPARRVGAFFTSWTGQKGRYNEPSNPYKWTLRCTNNYQNLYFENLKKSMAYNPFDAIACAIYARGDDFYEKHKAFVEKLILAQKELLSATP